MERGGIPWVVIATKLDKVTSSRLVGSLATAPGTSRANTETRGLAGELVRMFTGHDVVFPLSLYTLAGEEPCPRRYA